jgi:hypothetical protein
MANTQFIGTELQAFPRETFLTILHPMDNSHHDNWLAVFVSMVDSMNIFAMVITLDHNKQPVVACQIRVLGTNLFQRQES